MEKAATSDKADGEDRLAALEQTLRRLIGERDSAEGALRREKETSRMLREENERLRAKSVDPR